jgi:glycine/D-amino acid oxidase-like deaminating enzyme
VKGAKGAISVPVCSLWPYKLVCGLLKVSLGKGLNLQTNTYVTSVSQQPSKEGFFKIETSRGAMKARKILFATNGYTGAISPEYANVIVPWKGICSRTVVKSEGILPNLSNTYNLHNPSENPEYMNPRLDGSIIVGGGKDTFEKDYDLYWNNPDDSTLIEPAKHYFDNYVSDRFVDYASLDTSVENLWTGSKS